MSKYPEHEKLKKVKDEKNLIGDFLDWLRSDTDRVIAEYVDVGEFEDERLMVKSESISDILADYYDIDQEKLEQEKQQMLESLRE